MNWYPRDHFLILLVSPVSPVGLFSFVGLFKGGVLCETFPDFYEVCGTFFKGDVLCETSTFVRLLRSCGTVFKGGMLFETFPEI